MKTLRTSAPREWVLRQPGGQELTLRLASGESVTVGRDLTSDLPILDAGISRHHATFLLEGDELWLEDLHSQNGTFVNTERVSRTRIHSGDIITLGRIPLTITTRSARHEEVDPLRRLPPESLSRLLRASREFAAERGRAMIFQRLTELAIEVLKADRGVVFLWEEARDHFHPIAASPHELFQDAARFLGGSVAISVVRGRKARTLTEATSTGGSSAIVTPIFSGDRAMGILYLDRGVGQRGFQPADTDLLFAFAWMTSGALASLDSPNDARAWSERLASTVLDRTREITKLRSRVSTADGGAGGSSELLEELEQCLSSEAAGWDAGIAAGQDAALRKASSALHSARLGVEAARRLAERHPERYEEVSVERLIAELSGLDRGRRCYEISGGASRSVFCDPGELLLALRLLSESIAGRFEGAASAFTVDAAPADAPGYLGIRIAVALESRVSHAERPIERLLDRAAERIVSDRLHGELEVSPDGAWAEVRLPMPAASLSDTMVLPQKS